MSLFAFVIIHQGHKQKEINLCLAAFIDPASLKFPDFTVPPESMDPSGCGKTSSLPRAPTSRPLRVKICSTAVKTSATATLKILRQNRRGNTSAKQCSESSRVAFFITVAC